MKWKKELIRKFKGIYKGNLNNDSTILSIYEEVIDPILYDNILYFEYEIINFKNIDLHFDNYY